MKVYVLLGVSEYGHCNIISVHSDIESAEDCKIVIEENDNLFLYDYYEISEHEVEPPKDEWKNTID